MRKTLFIIMIMILYSCKKDSQTKLTLTGTWDISFTIEWPSVQESNQAQMVITQNSDNTLTGTFNWYEANCTLRYKSHVDNNNVAFDTDCGDGYLSFNGTINKDYDYLSGTNYLLSFIDYQNYHGTWQAQKK